MLCTNCNKNEANCHITTNINGKKTEQHLCAECAGEMGYGGMLSPPAFISGGMGSLFGLSSAGSEFEGMLSGMFGHKPQTVKTPDSTHSCPLCGSTLDDISRSGRVGCAECYGVFAPALNPYIRRIHGNASHTGKIPKRAEAGIYKKNELKRLKNELKASIESQEFENAAKLRDRIKELEHESE